MDSNDLLDTLPDSGAADVAGLHIDSYNLALPNPQGEGFLGDRASQTAFRALLKKARRRDLTGKDPFGKEERVEVSKKELDLVMVGGDEDAAHLVHLVAERFARRLTGVVEGFLDEPQWRKVEGIIFGGGFPESRVGRLAIRRAQRLLGRRGHEVSLHVLQHDADEAALLGWAALLPKSLRKQYDGFLAVDVGGSNIRCGIVEHSRHPEKAEVRDSMHWRHADDDPNRKEAIDRMAGMLNGLIALARTVGMSLAPVICIACPGQIEPDGRISRGGQNLPGDWESPFSLPEALAERLDAIDGTPPRILLHNDAVMQGLSECARMEQYAHWGVMTIGTGLGNASFSRG